MQLHRFETKGRWQYRQSICHGETQKTIFISGSEIYVKVYLCQFFFLLFPELFQWWLSVAIINAEFTQSTNIENLSFARS